MCVREKAKRCVRCAAGVVLLCFLACVWLCVLQRGECAGHGVRGEEREVRLLFFLWGSQALVRLLQFTVPGCWVDGDHTYIYSTQKTLRISFDNAFILSCSYNNVTTTLSSWLKLKFWNHNLSMLLP